VCKGDNGKNYFRAEFGAVLTTSQPDYLHNLFSVQSTGRTRSSSLVALARPRTYTPQVILYSVPCNVLHWTDNDGWLNVWVEEEPYVPCPFLFVSLTPQTYSATTRSTAHHGCFTCVVTEQKGGFSLAMSPSLALAAFELPPTWYDGRLSATFTSSRPFTDTTHHHDNVVICLFR